jgi:hypothetical protein
MSIPPFHDLVGPFKAVGNNLYWAHSGTSMLALHDLVGPFKAVGNYLGRKTVGPFVNVDTAFP